MQNNTSAQKYIAILDSIGTRKQRSVCDFCDTADPCLLCCVWLIDDGSCVFYVIPSMLRVKTSDMWRFWGLCFYRSEKLLLGDLVATFTETTHELVIPNQRKYDFSELQDLQELWHYVENKFISM